MEPKSECEVLVIGAGPVGMMAAASLEQQGIRVQIADRGFRPAARSYALALHPRTVELLGDLDLAERLVERGQPLREIAWYDGKRRRAEIALSGIESDFPFILVLAQSALEEILQGHLRSRGVPVLWNHRGTLSEIGAGQVTVKLESLVEASAGYGLIRSRSATQPLAETHAFYVIGADGYWSAVRHALEVEYQELDGAQTFGVFEFEADWSEDEEVRVVLHDDTTSVLWPLGDGRFRWSFELTRPDLPPPRLKRRLAVQMGDEAFPYLSREDLDTLIAARAPWFDAETREVVWSMAVRFERRLVDSFGRDNVWLAGDAAHLAGPVGAHSMNVGMQEAWDLSGRIGSILRQGEPRTLLTEYGDERLTEWRRLLAVDGTQDAEEAPDPWIRSNAARIADTIPASGEHLRKLAGQMGLSL